MKKSKIESETRLGKITLESTNNKNWIEEVKKIEEIKELDRLLIDEIIEDIVIDKDSNVKLMPVDHDSCIDRLLDYVPDLIEKTTCMMNKIVNNKKEETERILKEMQKRNSNDSNKKDNGKIEGNNTAPEDD